MFRVLPMVAPTSTATRTFAPPARPTPRTPPDRGGPQYGWDKTPVGKKAWVSAIVAAGTTLISVLVGIPLLRRKVERDIEAAAAAAKG